LVLKAYCGAHSCKQIVVEWLAALFPEWRILLRGLKMRQCGLQSQGVANLSSAQILCKNAFRGRKVNLPSITREKYTIQLVRLTFHSFSLRYCEQLTQTSFRMLYSQIAIAVSD